MWARKKQLKIIWLSTRKHQGKFNKLCCTGVQARLKSIWSISALRWVLQPGAENQAKQIFTDMQNAVSPSEVNESSKQSLSPMKITFINNFKNNVGNKSWSVHLQN